MLEREELLMLERLYHHARALEYILDATNQTRHREDKAIKRAHGHSRLIKHLAIELLGFYQPTLLIFHYSMRAEKLNPTWTKRTQALYKKINADRNMERS